MKHPLYPEPLKKGDTIGLIAPAGQLKEQRLFTEGVNIVQEMGFQVAFPRDFWPGQDYLADNDKNRALEFNSLLADSEVKALLALRGGYGCLRMLDRIDLALVASNPKILVGFSDITILQNYLLEQTGLVSLHGSVLTSLGNAEHKTLESFFRCLTKERPYRVEVKDLEIVRRGSDVTAPLVGGNLTSLVSLLGTRYDFSWDNKIVFLEDINEPLYKIDRMLTQLQLSGKFSSVAALLLGDFSLSTSQSENDKLRYLEAVWTRVLELCPQRSFPVWGHFPAGHCSCNITFPLGGLAEMRGAAKQLIFH